MTSLSRLFSLMVLLLAANCVNAQIVNQLKNPNADEGAQFWRAFGNAGVEQCANGSSCFVLRNGGYFIQDVTLPEDAAGQYAILVGRATSDNLRTDGSISGLPYLHGYMMNAGDPGGGRIYAYLDGQHMRSSARHSGEWVTLFGVFKIKPGTARIRFFLKQAWRNGTPHDGSAARFDQLALYILPDEVTARAFIGPASTGLIRSLVPAPRCDAGRETIPPFHGLWLGMSVDQVLVRFPGSEADPAARRAIDLLQNRRVTTRVPMFLNPHLKGLNYELQDIENFFLVFDERRLFRIEAHYRQPGVSSIDEFIEKYRYLVNMPDSNQWESVGANPGGNQGKYRICDGVEVRFFFAITKAARPSRISIIDTTLEGKSAGPPAMKHPTN